ncbi:MAG TPA: hypothetical protein VGE16_06215, partial [Albitalea sp.]
MKTPPKGLSPRRKPGPTATVNGETLDPGFRRDDVNGAHWMKHPLAALNLALLLAGCAALPAIDPSALPATPVAFKETDVRWTQAAPADAQPRGEWWKVFADPLLDGLVERASSDNGNVQIAAARLAQARALVRSAQA